MAKHYVVEKGETAGRWIFRNSKSGQFVTTVMSRNTFDRASKKAKPAIVEEALRGATSKAVFVGLMTNAIYTGILYRYSDRLGLRA